VEVDEFEAFVATHYERVRRALTVVLRDPRRAEDVTQEAFAQAMRHWSRVAAMERPEAWVYVVAVNRARRDLRHEVRPAAMIRPVLGQDVAGAVAISLAIETALAELTPRQRAVVVLRHLADLSTAQVAEAMGCAEGTVKSTLHTALVRLRVEMEDDEL
jgi:RNA polymerase sigma factor (sigma-70 family)